MTKINVAALQLAFTDDRAENIANVSELVREAAGKGAQVVLPPELFEGPYFCRVEDEDEFATALHDRRASLGAGDAEARRRTEDLDPDELSSSSTASIITTAWR